MLRLLFRHWLLAAALGLVGAAHAQQTTPTEPVDMARKVMACTLCHGNQGRATPGGFFPRIAGKPADYLYHQLLNFRDGRRNNDGMRYLLDTVSDDYLRAIARHFGSLDLPYPPPLPPQGDAATLARGEALVRRGDPARELPACTACHGEAMTGTLPAVPGLLGLPRDYLIGQLGAWRTGLRKAFAPDCMAHVAQTLAPDDISAVASWLAAQPLPADTHPAPPPTRPLPLHCGFEAVEPGEGR